MLKGNWQVLSRHRYPAPGLSWSIILIVKLCLGISDCELSRLGRSFILMAFISAFLSISRTAAVPEYFSVYRQDERPLTGSFHNTEPEK